MPDTAAEQADLTAGEASLLEGQRELWPGFAHSAVQTGGSPEKQNGRFPKGCLGRLQV